MLLDNKKIAIIGGGPGGLTLARLLEMKGADVKVYERDLNKDARVQGATLDLHMESGLEALRRAGLMEAFMENYRPGADLMRLVDNKGNILFDQHDMPQGEPFADEHFRPEIDRGPLRQMLLASLKPDTVVWNSHVTSLTRTGSGWDIVFDNGQTASADLVIGVDGANSKIRPFVTDIQPFYSGVTVLEGSIYDADQNAPRLSQLLKGGKVFAMGDERTIILSSKGDGSMSFYIGMKTPETWLNDCGIDFGNNDELREWFAKEFAGWDEVWNELLAKEHSVFAVRPLYCMPFDQVWEAQKDITILGDAAHLMPPYAGEGVNMAMLDALELSNCLTGEDYPDIHTAIAAYEVQMRCRASDAARMSQENTEMMHSGGAMEMMVGMFGGAG